MKNSKTIQEQIDGLAIQARGMYEACQKASPSRDFSDEEATEFDEITNKRIPALQEELKKAVSVEEEITRLSQHEKRRTSVENLAGILEAPSRPRVLPVNGEFENAASEPRVYHRMAKLRAFKNDADAYNCGMWLRSMIAKAYNRDDQQAARHIHRLGWQVTNTAIEGTGSLGGFLVPAPLSQTIIDVRENVGVARRILKIMPMTSDTLTMARRDGGLTVYYVGEAAAITASDKTWGQVELIAKKRAVAHQISQELQDDALISIVDDAVNEMAYALAAKEDAETILGDGTSTYGGVQGLLSSLGSAGVSTAATGHDTWAELDIADFTAAMGKLPDKYSRQPVWVCSANFFFSTMVRVLASAGGNTIADLQAGDGGARFLGRPVYFTDQMPKTTAVSTVCALFGTFEMGAILGERTGITMARSDDYAFLNDVTTLKATTRYDIEVHAGGDATNAGAYVGLSTAS